MLIPLGVNIGGSSFALAVGLSTLNVTEIVYMSGIEIQVRERCHCENGVIPCSEWLRWQIDYDAYVAKYREFSNEFHIDPYLRNHPQPACEEEHPCPECEGSTWLFKWIPLVIPLALEIASH